MPEILSQAEIDELLNALKSGAAKETADKSPEDKNQVRAYDFRTANRFTKDQIRSLSIVLESYSQMFANQVTNLLRISCECEVLSLEEMGYSDFNNALPSPVILGAFGAPPLEGSLLIQVSPEVAYLLINRLLGGLASTKESSKQFTEIEIALIERFLRKIMHTFDEAWEKILSVRSKLERLDTNPQFMQIAGPNDAVAVGTLSLKVGEDTGLFSFCLPRASITKVASQLNTRTLFQADGGGTREPDAQNMAVISERLERAAVTAVAQFQDTPARVQDIVNLQEGDVIRLMHRVGDPLTVRIQHIPKFRVSMGTAESQYAVKIMEIIDEGGSEDEPAARRE